MVDDTVFLPGATILITDVGDSYPPGDQTNQDLPGPSLVCVTSNVNNMCCRGGDIRVVVLWGIGYILMVP